MIVRVMGEGQYRLGDDAVGRLNELDERAQVALDREDVGELDRYLDEMAALSEGAQVDDELAKMKAELGQGSAPAALPEGGEKKEAES